MPKFVRQGDNLLIGNNTFTGTNTFSGAVVLSGGVTTDVSTEIVPVVIGAVQEDKAGAGALSVATYYTAWTTGGAVAGTLAAGSIKGQLKKIRSLSADEGTLTLNTTSTIVFTDTGDSALLMWNGAAWVVLELSNDADGATAPAYTP
jgi:hypothetical protein